MVYQFMFDVYLFDTQFSDLQYVGLVITVGTFALDIYFTCYPLKKSKKTEEDEALNEKSEDRAVEGSELSQIHASRPSISNSARARQLVGIDSEPLIHDEAKRAVNDSIVSDQNLRSFSTDVSYKF